MRFFISTAIGVAVLFPCAGSAQWTNDGYTSPRNATVSASGAKRIEIDAGPGFLHVKGGTAGAEVRVTGMARASRENLLPEIKLIAERRGDAVYIKADIADQDKNWGGDNNYRGLDLTIEVPQIPLEIEDGSGDIDIRGTAGVRLTDGSGAIEMENIGGPVEIEDGSGEIQLRGVRGNVTINDGSGEIVVRGVTGNLTINDDGSGSIEAHDLTGSFIVKSDGSGEIKVDGVGGDLDVRSKGSGAIAYNNVKGAIKIPDSDRRRRERYYR